MDSFSGWNGKTVYTVVEIKPYVAPGNSAQVKGRMAMWLSSPASKRNLIVFVDVVHGAIRFITEPAKRGCDMGVARTNFGGWAGLQPAYRRYPGVHQHAGIYVALAKLVLGLPEDWEEPVSVRERALAEALEHPDISTNDGLLLDTLYAYAEGAKSPDVDDLPARAFAAVRRRFGDRPQHDLTESLVLEVRDLDQRGKADEANEDIVGAPVVWFAFLYINLLQWMGRVRQSAVTTVVNRLADAHDAGMLKVVARRMDREAAKAAATEEAAFFKIVRRIRRR
jgi:hypothetical protein